MTTAVQTFGISWELVRDWIPQFPAILTAGTVPSAASFARFLTQESSDWCGRLTQMGIDPLAASAVPGSQVYGVMQKNITLACALRALVAAERTPTEMMTSMAESYELRFNRITAQPGSLGDGQNPDVWTVATHVTDEADLRRNVAAKGLGAVLASRGQV